MTDWHSVVIREFWDYPRAVVAMRGSETFYFYSPFDESLDDYTPHYHVYRLPRMSEEELKGSWVGFEDKALERLENLPLRSLPFDISRVSLRDEVTKSVSGKDHRDG